jgi:hypothetical protein
VEAIVAYFKVLQPYLPGGTEDKKENPQSGWLICMLRLEPTGVVSTQPRHSSSRMFRETVAKPQETVD